MRKTKGLTVVTSEKGSLIPFYSVLKAQQERQGRELRRQERLYGKPDSSKQS